MINIHDPIERRRILRFLLVGIGNTAFGYALFAAFIALGLQSSLSLLGATLLGVVFNFFTTGRLVFTSADSRLLPRFLLSYGFTYLFNLALLTGLEALGIDALIAQLMCIPPTVLLSYFILKTFVFGRRPT